MKATFQKIGIIFLGVMLLLTIGTNCVMFVIINKISSAEGIFDKYNVCVKYNVFDHEWFAIYSTLITIVLLILFVVLFVREFVKLKK
jgi:hypothetical protein